MVRPPHVGLLLLVLAACTEPEPEPEPTPDPVDSGTVDTSPPVDTGTASTTETADTGTGPVFDCATIPNKPTATTMLGAPRGYHDLAFDVDDNIVGSDNTVLLKVAPDDSYAVFGPPLGFVQQMAWLPNGDLAVAVDNSGVIARVAPDGAVSVISPDVYAYGLILGPDEMLYAANNSTLMRIDPDTGQKTPIIDKPQYSPKVLAFNRDGTELYFGTLGGGDVYRVPLDANYDPSGPPELLAGNIGGWHDGLGVDVCGNVYLADYTTTALYRITPSGQVQRLLDPPLTTYGHGLEWGTGSGGWSETALYMPQPYNGNTVVEVEIGVPHASWQGTVLNAP